MPSQQFRPRKHSLFLDTFTVKLKLGLFTLFILLVYFFVLFLVSHKGNLWSCSRRLGFVSYNLEVIVKLIPMLVFNGFSVTAVLATLYGFLFKHV